MKYKFPIFSKGTFVFKNSFFVLVLLLAVMLTAFANENPKENSQIKSSESSRLIVGYQTTWATAGEIMETLVHTSISQLHNSHSTFQPFLIGPDMNKAALEGSIDAITSGIAPTVGLLAESDDWVSVCRLIDFPVSMIARTGSGIKSFSDLKGKKVGVPFGAGAHLYLVQRLRDNNLTIGTRAYSVEVINVNLAELGNVLKQGGVDAIAIWEPNTTIIEGKKIGYSFEDKRYIGLLTVRKSLIEENPKEVIALIKSLIEASLYFARNRNQADEWFSNRSNLDLKLVKKIRVIEPNLKAKRIEDISVQIMPNDIKLFQEVADQMYLSKLIKQPVKISSHINLSLERQAVKELLKEGSKAGSIQIVN